MSMRFVLIDDPSEPGRKRRVAFFVDPNDARQGFVEGFGLDTSRLGALLPENSSGAATNAPQADFAPGLRAGADIAPSFAHRAHRPGETLAPMAGRVIEVAVAVGDRVRSGAALVVLEAMKTEQTLVAAQDGTVLEVCCAAEQQVADGAVLVRIGEPNDS